MEYLDAVIELAREDPQYVLFFIVVTVGVVLEIRGEDRRRRQWHEDQEAKLDSYWRFFLPHRRRRPRRRDR